MVAYCVHTNVNPQALMLSLSSDSVIALELEILAREMIGIGSPFLCDTSLCQYCRDFFQVYKLHLTRGIVPAIYLISGSLFKLRLLS